MLMMDMWMEMFDKTDPVSNHCGGRTQATGRRADQLSADNLIG